MVVFFHDVNAIMLMFNCELMGTIAGEDSAHLEEQNGIWLCHGISSDYDASARQSRKLKKGPVPEAVNRDVSQPSICCKNSEKGTTYLFKI